MKYIRVMICILVLTMTSCDKKYVSSIPNYEVYLELDLSYEDKDLLGVQAYKIYTPLTINQAVEKTGFGGVLVYNGLNNNASTSYYAFDMACPYEAVRSVTVAVDDDDTGIYAICPKCGSKFELLNGIGNPVEGPSEYYLKSYRVTQNGNKLYVTN